MRGRRSAKHASLAFDVSPVAARGSDGAGQLLCDMPLRTHEHEHVEDEVAANAWVDGLVARWHRRL